jgi:hypothetical protein
VSSNLSSNMASSSVKSWLLVWTPGRLTRAMEAQRKKAAFSRGLLEPFGHHRCPVRLIAWASRPA